jgi:aryl-alcohol dehydrogenase
MFEPKSVMSGERIISAAVLRAPGEGLRIERLKLRRPLPGEVLVRLAATGICHTDISGLRGNFPIPLPCVLGHEGAGYVEELGAGISGLSVGDPVVGWFWRLGGGWSLCGGAARFRDD